MCCRKLANTVDICLGVDQKIEVSPQSDEYYDKIATSLIDNKNAKIVLIWGYVEQARFIMEALNRTEYDQYFIFLAPDGWGISESEWKGIENVAHGLYSIKISGSNNTHHQQWLSSLNFGFGAGNPWYQQFWERLFNCSLSEVRRRGRRCSIDEATRLGDIRDLAGPVHLRALESNVIDATYALAKSIHDAVEACPGKWKTCLNSSQVVENLFNLSFQSPETGRHITFDKHGDFSGKYVFLNNQRDANGKYGLSAIGEWSESLGMSVLDGSSLQWPLQHGNAQKIESVCSITCPRKHFRIQKEPRCCWDCRPCRKNEHLVANATDCIPCPPFYWPDNESATKCLPIQPEHLYWTDVVCIVVIILALLCIGFTVLIGIAYILNRSARLIKACSRELSFVMLLGVLVSCVISISLVAPPSSATCVTNYFGFHLSFTTLYAPLLTRTNRIHRIFKAGKTSKQRPRFSGSAVQLVIVSIVISIQVGVHQVT